MKRTSGILFPISSLDSRYGIGCFSKEAYDFVDFLEKSGQSYWQILPLGPTGFGDSPYQPFSAFAGNPYFVCLDTLVEEELLTEAECAKVDFGSDPERVDYGALYNGRPELLALAASRFREKLKKDKKEKEAYEAFCTKESGWLDDYCLFRALKDKNGGLPWYEWEKGLKTRSPKDLKAAAAAVEETVETFRFIQYAFEKQWQKLRAYANGKGIRIIGDLPYYVSMDSSDVWAHPEAFLFDKKGDPVSVAGCPPDAFSPTGQLWGNPIYDWAHMKKRGYDWWMDRIRRNQELYDVIRIDHFNGFESYYAIPYGAETAEKGKHEKGPGMDFFRAMKEQLGEVDIIAEDLGTLTPETEALLRESGYPGMKVLQYAFDWTEYSYYLPYNHIPNSVVYTGTHDNMTSRQWIESLNDHDRDFARRYIHSENSDYGAFVWDFIREAYRSVSNLCIIPLQDYLVKGREARINTPGTAGENWQWRIAPRFLSEDLARSIYGLAKLYGRLPKPEEKKAEPEKEEKK